MGATQEKLVKVKFCKWVHPPSYLKAPVTSNFSLTTTKITENGVTLYFLETLDAGILIR